MIGWSATINIPPQQIFFGFLSQVFMGSFFTGLAALPPLPSSVPQDGKCASVCDLSTHWYLKSYASQLSCWKRFYIFRVTLVDDLSSMNHILIKDCDLWGNILDHLPLCFGHSKCVPDLDFNIWFIKLMHTLILQIGIQLEPSFFNFCNIYHHQYIYVFFFFSKVTQRDFNPSHRQMMNPISVKDSK